MAEKKEPKPNGLKCEICGKPLVGKQRRACGKPHSQALRSRARSDRALLERQVMEHNVTEAVSDEIVQKAREVTQEAMTKEVLKQIERFVYLIPNALNAIEKNLGSDDPDIRQKAATTLLRYTMGNASVAPPSLEQQSSPLQVVFAVPRSDQAGPTPGGGVRPLLEPPAGAVGIPSGGPIIDVESTDLDDNMTCEHRICMECGLEKCVDEFVGESPRCKDCDRRLKERVEKQFGHVDLG